MGKIFILLIILFHTTLSADYLYSTINKCIKNFYFKNGDLYYQLSKTNDWRVTTANEEYRKIHGGFIYDAANDVCIYNELTNILGIKEEDYNFLIALTAILLGFTTVFFMSYIAIGVVRR